MKQEKYLLAEYHFKKALEIHPSNPLLQSHVAMVVQKDSNRLDEALARFEAAEQLAPEQPMYTFRKAHTLALMGRFEVFVSLVFFHTDILDSRSYHRMLSQTFNP